MLGAWAILFQNEAPQALGEWEHPFPESCPCPAGLRLLCRELSLPWDMQTCTQTRHLSCSIAPSASAAGYTTEGMYLWTPPWLSCPLCLSGWWPSSSARSRPCWAGDGECPLLLLLQPGNERQWAQRLEQRWGVQPGCLQSCVTLLFSLPAKPRCSSSAGERPPPIPVQIRSW